MRAAPSGERSEPDKQKNRPPADSACKKHCRAPGRRLASNQMPMAFDLMVRAVGIEPTHLAVPDFESGASTSSTTPAENRMPLKVHAPSGRMDATSGMPPSRPSNAGLFLGPVSAQWLEIFARRQLGDQLRAGRLARGVAGNAGLRRRLGIDVGARRIDRRDGRG